MSSNNGNHYEDGGGRGGRGPADDEDRKLFLGGLSWETTEEDLKTHFGAYGNVDAVSIKYDSVTGNPRGFGFITFVDGSVIDKVLEDCPHTIRDKTIDPKRAKSRPICKKIFVGGVDAGLPEEDIKKYFSQYGKVEGIELPFDRTRGRRREFCFIIFDTEESADLACKEAKQTLGSRECDVKKAQPQPVAQQQKQQEGRGGRDNGYDQDGGRQSRGGGRGGRGGGGRSGYGSDSGYGGTGGGYGNGSGGGYSGGQGYGQSAGGYGGYNASAYAAPAATGYGSQGYGAAAGYNQSAYADYYNQYYGDYYAQYGYQGYGGAEGEYPASAYASQGSTDGYGSQGSHHSGTGSVGKIPSKSVTGSSSRGPSTGYHPYGGRGGQSSH